jgi:hypothetical protein
MRRKKAQLEILISTIISEMSGKWILNFDVYRPKFEAYMLFCFHCGECHFG